MEVNKIKKRVKTKKANTSNKVWYLNRNIGLKIGILYQKVTLLIFFFISSILLLYSILKLYFPFLNIN
jgi:hypothetical protein